MFLRYIAAAKLLSRFASRRKKRGPRCWHSRQPGPHPLVGVCRSVAFWGRM